MNKFLDLFAGLMAYLQGKKTMLVAIAQALNTYAMAAGYVDAQLGGLIASIILILAGGAVVATNQLGGRMGVVKGKNYFTDID